MTEPGRETNERTYRVAIVQTVLSHYRVPFFEALSAENPCWHLEIVHSGRENEHYRLRETEALKETVVRRIQIPFLGYQLSFQVGALHRLGGSQLSIVILEGSFGILSNLFILVLRKLRHLPTIYWVTGWDRPEVQGWKKGLRDVLIRCFARQADAIVAYGTAASRYMVSHGVDPSRITVAQNTVDVESLALDEMKWRAAALDVKTRLGIGGKCVLYVGRVVPTKRLEDLIVAMRLVRQRIPNAELVVVGTGPELPKARAQAGDGVHFVGEVIDGIEAYFAGADVFVMPGTGGLALNQAMAFGLPIVVTVSDGTHEDLVIPGENGLVAPLADSNALAECIVQVLKDSRRQASMGERSKSIVLQRASLKNMAVEFGRAVRQVLEAAR
ncbi:MAG TPA: glycosyltransferase family 4 protein [Candidatus Polarisedimenticolia bacterium]|nr:glycosyltransferase family 4 protein [Candidatus Polarisedimenticolia bacterium]